MAVSTTLTGIPDSRAAGAVAGDDEEGCLPRKLLRCCRSLPLVCRIGVDSFVRGVIANMSLQTHFSLLMKFVPAWIIWICILHEICDMLLLKFCSFVMLKKKFCSFVNFIHLFFQTSTAT